MPRLSTSPFAVVRDFEQALCDYTGARFAVTTTSCTMALLLSLLWCRRLGLERVTIPRRTYVGVAMSVRNAGLGLDFHNDAWAGAYRLRDSPVYDCARRFTSGMYQYGQMQCVSFHWAKILGIGQGGAILHDEPEADAYLRQTRFDGRTEGARPVEDMIDALGYHAYMMPRDAAEGLTRLALLPGRNDDLPNDNYPDLSRLEVFR